MLISNVHLLDVQREGDADNMNEGGGCDVGLICNGGVGDVTEVVNCMVCLLR